MFATCCKILSQWFQDIDPKSEAYIHVCTHTYYDVRNSSAVSKVKLFEGLVIELCMTFVKGTKDTVWRDTI